jgi:hypothetical protein
LPGRANPGTTAVALKIDFPGPWSAMARRLIRRRCAAAVLGLGLGIGAAAGPAFADVTVSPAGEPAGASGVLTFRVSDDASDAGTTVFELDLPDDHPLLGVVPASKFGWDMAVERAATAGPTAGRVTRVIWTSLSTTTAIQPGHVANFSIGVRRFPVDTPVVRIRALQTWSNGDVVEWLEPLLPGGPTPLHPALQIALTSPGAPGSPTSSTEPVGTPTPQLGSQATPSPALGTPIADLPAARTGPTMDQVDTALVLAAGAFVLALVAAVMAAVALTRRPRGTRPDPEKFG